ncbi:MAG: hypothetical protein L6E13_13150, partial [Firmicutes bacterium]|nr:hypothetical protein [Bacillota bacterium]
MDRWRRMGRPAAAAALAIALVLSGVAVSVWGRKGPGSAPAWGVGVPVAQAAAITLAPLQADDRGVDPESGFVLESAAPLEEEALRQGLRVEPEISFRLERVDREGRRWHLWPGEPLRPGRIYRFTLAPGHLAPPAGKAPEAGEAGDPAPAAGSYRWAFQVRETFRVVGTLPRNAVVGVPVDTGIELIFSHEGYGDPAPYFEITPRVEGRFERRGKVAIFLPAQRLSPGTLYTVRLRAGLPLEGTDEKLAEDVVFQFETERPEDQRRTSLGVRYEFLEFTPRDTPFLVLHRIGAAAADGQRPTAAVTVYRYPDAAAYARALARREALPPWAQATRAAALSPVEGLTEALRFTGELVFEEDRILGDVLAFPGPLPPGYYLADIRVGEARGQVHLQVTDLAAYTAVTTTETLVWIHQLSTGLPAAGVRVEPLPTGEEAADEAMGAGETGRAAGAGGTAGTAVTDARGLATLPTPPHRPLYLLARAPGGAEAVLITQERDPWRWQSGLDDRPDETPYHYWRYLYLDRPLYKPDDTVHFWGFLRPREEGARPVPEVEVRVVRTDYSGPESRDLVLASTRVPVQRDVFTGALALPSVRPGWYTVQVLADGVVMHSHWLEVKTYTKPAYRLEVSADRRAVLAGEPITFSVAARFFEGTPVPGLALKYQIHDGATTRDGTVTTGPDGTATIRHVTHERPPQSDAETFGHITVVPAGPEEGEIQGYHPFQFFPRDVAVTASARRVAAGAGEGASPAGEVTVRLQAVDLRARNAPEATGYEEYRGAPVPDRPVTLELARVEWEAIERGQTYDFIEKRVIPRYEYRRHLVQVARHEGRTDGTGTLRHTFPLEKGRTYEVTIRTEDRAGRPVVTTLFLSGDLPVDPGSTYRWYYVDLSRNGPGDGTRFALGEPVTAELWVSTETGNARIPSRTGGFLFFTARQGLGRAVVSDEPRVSLPFLGTDIPSMTLWAVHFDGRTYHQADRVVHYNPAAQGLQVTVTPDRPEYRPGDRVVLDVAVADAQGRPVAATVNLNLVDEALYALRDRNVDFLESLYGDWMPSGVLFTRGSHKVPQHVPVAEQGGEGDGGRHDFRDMAYFATLTTGPDGRARAEFRLPDNLTTWRMTYHAAAEGDPGPALRHAPQAASGTLGIPVRLPFFAEVVLGETYLVGDQPVVTARAYGTALGTGDRVTFTATLTGPGGRQELGEATAAGHEPVAWTLPRLQQPGTYSFRVEARGPGGLSDALERRFTVQETFYLQDRLDFHLLTPGLRIQGAEEGITTLTFADARRGQYLAVLERLVWAWGHRLERRLGAAVARSLLETLLPDPAAGDLTAAWPEDPPDFSPLRYQTPEGGIAPLPYAEADLALTARLADLAADRFDRVALAQYLGSVAAAEDRSRREVIAALYGLAALGEPVLLRIEAFLAAPNLTLDEELDLMLAATALGHHEGVRARFHELLEKHGEAVGPYLRIRPEPKAGAGGSAGSEEAVLAATARAAVVAARLGEPSALPLFQYAAAEKAEAALLQPELLLAIRDGLAQLPSAPVSFTYALDGQPVRRELRPGEVFRVALTPDQWRGLEIREVTGEVGLTVAYLTREGAGGAPAGAGASVTREFQVGGRATLEWSAGDLVRIVLRPNLGPDALEGPYEVTDYLPAGLRPVVQPYLRGVRDPKANYPVEVMGQRVTFFYWPGASQREIVYYARAVSPGTYTAEAPEVRHAGTGLTWARGQRQEVRLR